MDQTDPGAVMDYLVSAAARGQGSCILVGLFLEIQMSVVYEFDHLFGVQWRKKARSRSQQQVRQSTESLKDVNFIWLFVKITYLGGS